MPNHNEQYIAQVSTHCLKFTATSCLVRRYLVFAFRPWHSATLVRLQVPPLSPKVLRVWRSKYGDLGSAGHPNVVGWGY